MKENCDKTLNTLQFALTSYCTKYLTVLLWIPSHCGIAGNEVADNLAKEGANFEQTDLSTNLNEAKTLIKAKLKGKWNEEHSSHKTKDPHYQLDRKEKVIICRLRSNHNRLRHHMFNKFKVGDSAKCTCGTEDQTTTHILQSCTLLEENREQFWPQKTAVVQKLYGSLAKRMDIDF